LTAAQAAAFEKRREPLGPRRVPDERGEAPLASRVPRAETRAAAEPTHGAPGVRGEEAGGLAPEAVTSMAEETSSKKKQRVVGDGSKDRTVEASTKKPENFRHYNSSLFARNRDIHAFPENLTVGDTTWSTKPTVSTHTPSFPGTDRHRSQNEKSSLKYDDADFDEASPNVVSTKSG
jgi:hypothetical protein